MSLLDLFLGTGLAGCIGETCKLAIIVGYIYLVVRKVIKWWQPLLYVVLSGFLSCCLAACAEGASFDISLFPAFMLSGGLMFGAVFMATDYVTSPKGIYGQIVYYVCLAVLTSLLRYFAKIEVVSFVIMLMNLIVPLIDTYIVRKPFGYKKEKKQKEAK
jgi:electron transport complex protein RnfD